jgi:mono/diheme cytochrome c family protein
MKRNNSFCLAITTALALSLRAATAQDAPMDAPLDASKLPPASSQTGVTYDKDIKAIFDKSCIKCHGAEHQRGKMRLDSHDAAVKGGKSAKDVVAGKSGESRLVFAVAHVGDDDRAFMPPPQEKSHVPPLTKDQIGLIRAWIDQGAK